MLFSRPFLYRAPIEVTFTLHRGYDLFILTMDLSNLPQKLYTLPGLPGRIPQSAVSLPYY